MQTHKDLATKQELYLTHYNVVSIISRCYKLLKYNATHYDMVPQGEKNTPSRKFATVLPPCHQECNFVTLTTYKMEGNR